MVVTWNPSDKAAQVTLSNGNLTATSASVNPGVRATDSQSTGKWYFEVKVDAIGAAMTVGVANTTASLAVGSPVGVDANAWAFTANGSQSGPYHSNSFSPTGGGWTTNDIVMLAWDASAGKLWLGLNGSWISGDPAAGTSSSFSSVTGTLFPAVSVHTNAQATANFGATAFGYTPPSGFTAWGGSSTVSGDITATETQDTTSIKGGKPVTTTWNAYNKNGTATLSNGDLTVTDNGIAGHGKVKATTYKTSGKWYFEAYVDNQSVSPAPTQGFGLADETWNARDTSEPYLGQDTHGWSYYFYSGIYRTNGGTVALDTGAVSTGNYVMLAVDIDAGKLWFGKNGTWANSGNPVTGSNATGTFTANTVMYPAWSETNNGSSITANFGNTAFQYGTPTGFEPWTEPTRATGSFALTEAQDTFLVNGNSVAANAANMAITEDPDVFAIDGTIIVVASGNFAITETQDSCVINGTFFGDISATLAATETGDSFVGTGGSASAVRIYVACGTNGSSGTVSYSDEGVTWFLKATLPTSNALNSIHQAQANGTWVTVGRNATAQGKIYTSPDLDTWTERTVPAGTGILNSVYYHDGRWIAVSNNAQFITSVDDGVTWTTAYTDTLGAYRVYYGNRWVATGQGRYWYSDNGTSWTRVIIPGAGPLYALGYNSTKWVMAGSGKIFNSTDGATFTSVVSGSTSINYRDVRYANSTWIMCASVAPYSVFIYKSSDGISWTNQSLSTTAGLLYSVAHNDSESRWLTAGSRNTTSAVPAYRSDDATTWTSSPPGMIGGYYWLTQGTFEEAGPVSANFNVTEAQDTALLNGVIVQSIQGTFTLTEATDTLVFTGFSDVPVEVNFSVTETQDIAAIAGVKVLPDNPGDFALIDSPDTFAITAVSVTTRNILWIVAVEAQDNVLINGSVPIHGTFIVTEDADTASFGQSGAGLALKVTQETADQFTTLTASLFDGGTLNIYTGSQPDSPEDAPSGTLLAQIILPDPAFGEMVDGQAVQVGDWTGAATSSGTPGWFRLVDATGEYWVDGSAGTNNTDLVISTPSFVTGDPLNVTNAVFQLVFLNESA